MPLRSESGLPHADVAVIGAGVSGIGVACELRRQCPGRTFVMLDDQPSFGGTWITHRFPGVRSDSDLYTYGYSFKPWKGPPIATADEILLYLGEVIAENALAPHMRYRHRLTAADWSGQSGNWTLKLRTPRGEEEMTAQFLFLCQGYYRHDRGYTPQWPAMEEFEGRIVHPQTWPGDLDCTGKRVIVVGSGATAATIVPALAGKAAHVTMLQRSPTYYFSGSNTAPIVEELRRLGIDEAWIYEIARRKFLDEDAAFMDRVRAEPETVASELIDDVRTRLGPGHDVAAHFTPAYRPWQQRLCLIPDGDMLKAIRAGRASVVTDTIERFTRSGLRLASGRELTADIVVTATGLELASFGDIAFFLDGRPVTLADRPAFHGMMIAGVPNLAWVFGYLRSSWTLRVELVAGVVCRLLNHMQALGLRQVVAAPGPDEAEMTLGPWVEPEDFNPGYIRRGVNLMPKRGDRPQWQHSHDYWVDKDRLPAIRADDPALRYA